MTDISAMSCEEALGRLLDYLRLELDEPDHRSVEEHLRTCHSCFSRAEFEKRLEARLAETGQQAPSGALKERIRSLLERY